MEGDFRAASIKLEHRVMEIHRLIVSPYFPNKEMGVELAFRHLRDLASELETDLDFPSESLERLAAISDGPFKLPKDFGRIALYPRNEFFIPHAWASAHEAGLGISKLAVEFMLQPLDIFPNEKNPKIEFANLQPDLRKEFERLLEQRKFLAMPAGRFADLTVHIQRERAIFIARTSDSDQPSGQTTQRKAKPGRRSNLEYAKKIVSRYECGLRNNEWKGPSQFLQEAFPDRWKEGPRGAQAWFGMLKKRVNEMRNS